MRKGNFTPSCASPAQNKASFFLGSVVIFLMLSSTAVAQTRTVNGVIKNESGEPVAAVTITVKETGIGTTTDAQGKFSVQVPQGKNVLVFSIVGYEDKE